MFKIILIFIIVTMGCGSDNSVSSSRRVMTKPVVKDKHSKKDFLIATYDF